MSSFISRSFYKLKDTFPGQWFDTRSNSSLTFVIIVVHCYLVIQSCLTLCDPMDCSTPGFPVLHCLPEFTQTHVHWVGCHPIISSSLIPLSSPLQFFPSISIFSNKSALHSRWPKYWSFSFNISRSNEHSGLSSFRMDWLWLIGE